MALLLPSLLHLIMNSNPVHIAPFIGYHMSWFVSDIVIWLYWWANLLGLQLAYVIGAALSPLYWMICHVADVKFTYIGQKSKYKNPTILPINGRLLVLQDVFNVHSHYLFYLHKKLISYEGA